VLLDGCSLPFRSRTVGALVMVDVIHYLPTPLEFCRRIQFNPTLPTS
jgi:hypothetical protein